jgi:WD40 repeat protein
MDLDEIPNGNGHAYPSPKEVEPTPPPIFTEGPEKSAQVEKIAELGADTLYLTLSDPETPDNRPLALFSAWNPQDPTVLAGAGTDGLARLWTLSRGAGEQNGHVTPFRNLVDSSNTKGSNAKSTTTALAWTSDGSALALASEWDDENATPIPGTARISIFNSDGSLAGEHSGFDSPILCLQWNPSNSALLALVPDNNFLMVHIFHGSTQITFPTDQRLDQNLHAVWTGESEFILYGGRILSLFSVSDGKIMRSGKFEVPDGRRLLRASYDRHTQLLATASEDGIIDVGHYL